MFHPFITRRSMQPTHFQSTVVYRPTTMAGTTKEIEIRIHNYMFAALMYSLFEAE